MAEPQQTINDPTPFIPSDGSSTTNPDAQAGYATDVPGVAAMEKFLGMDKPPTPTTEDFNPLTSTQNPTTPVNVPGFEIIGEIGRGGMGIVYRARDLTIERDVAVKVLQDKYAPDSPAAQRFLEEARITGQLQHPGIPAVHQIGMLPDGRPYLAMKLIKGQTLEAHLNERPTEDVEEFLCTRPIILPPGMSFEDLVKMQVSGQKYNWLAVFESICQAVGFAHSRQVIHRDLKPSNIMVGAFGEVQVMDWGLAKVLSNERNPNSARQQADLPIATEIRSLRDSDTRDGSIMGTAAYMSPEQAGGETDRINQRSDVFSLGAILCTILTGQPPYTAKDFKSVLRDAIRCKTEEALQRLEACGAERDLIALAHRCLLEEPLRRPDDANAVAIEVSRIRLSAEQRARDAEMQRAKAEVQAAEQRKRRLVQLALLIALVAGAAVSIFYAVRADRIAATANQNAEEAKTQTTLANETASQLARQLNESRRLLDLSRLRNAQAEFANNSPQLARDALNEIAQENRCIGWRILQRQFEGSLFTVHGHTDDVTSVALSADGSRLATGSKDGTARLWDVRRGLTIQVFRGHTDRLNSVALTADGSRLATGSNDNTARLWDSRTGEMLVETRGHTDAVVSVAMSADGSQFATASLDTSVRLWDIRNGLCIREFKGHTSGVSSVAFSTDGDKLATGSLDKTARLWDTCTGQTLMEFNGHSNSVNSVALSADGNRLVTGSGNNVGSGDNTARLWDIRTGQYIQEFKGQTGAVSSVALSADGNRLVTGSLDKTARLWDARTGQTLLEFKGHTHSVLSVALSADGSRLVTCSPDKTVRVWDAHNGHTRQEFKGHMHSVLSVALSTNGSRLATGSADRTARLWDGHTGQSLHEFAGHSDNVSSVALSADGSRLATGSFDNTARLWDTRTGQMLQEFAGHSDNVSSVALSADGSRLATGSFDNTARLWDTRSGQTLQQFKGHTHLVLSVALSADGSRLATGSFDNTAFLWDARTRQILKEFKGHSAGVQTVVLSADGRLLGTGSSDNTARLWDTRSGQTLQEFKGHTKSVTTVALSSDGSRLITGSLDNTTRLWDARTGQSLQEYKGHAAGVSSVALSRDESVLVTGSFDTSVVLWDARTTQSLLEFRGHTGRVSSVSLSSDGSRLATGSHDKTARLWDASTGQSFHEFTGHPASVSSVYLSADGSRLITRDTSGKTLTWNTTTGLAIPNVDPPSTFKSLEWVANSQYHFIVVGERVRRVPTVIEVDEKQRLWLTRPDPDWHVEQCKKFESEKNAYAAALHRSFEQHARGVVAVDYNQFDKAYWHFVAAALLKPPIPKAVEIQPKK